jgi:CCR4-NOT transcription complex subunit 4
MHRIKAEKRQKDQQKKQKATENRKHLANVRVVQRNLVFVVGLSPRLADPEVASYILLTFFTSLNKIIMFPFQVLKRHEYFGKFGKIHKVVINHSTQYAGSQVENIVFSVNVHVSECYRLSGTEC